MTKQLNLRSAIIEAAAAAPRRRLETTHIVIIVIMILFAGKQSMDVADEWHIQSMQSAEQIEARTAECLKEYNDKLCNTGSAPDKCRELLKCIYQKDPVEYMHILEIATDELASDFWFPATLMGLLMLWKLSEAANLAKQATE